MWLSTTPTTWSGGTAAAPMAMVNTGVSIRASANTRTHTPLRMLRGAEPGMTRLPVGAVAHDRESLPSGVVLHRYAPAPTSRRIPA